MSFKLEENFGEAGAGMTTPQAPSIEKVMGGMNGMLDAALVSQADLAASSSSLDHVTASGVTAETDLTVTGVATGDVLLSVLVLEGGDGGSVTDVKSLDLDKVQITAADTVVIDEDTSGSLVLVSFING